MIMMVVTVLVVLVVQLVVAVKNVLIVNMILQHMDHSVVILHGMSMELIVPL